MQDGPDSQRILIVHGKQPAPFFETSATAGGHRLEAFSAAAEVIDRLAQGERPRLILLDLDGPEGLEGLRRMVALGGHVPIVVAAEPSESDLLLEALRAGAHNFLVRPVRRQDLEAVLSTGKKADGDPAVYNDRLSDDLSFVASSPVMLKMRRQVSQIAPADVPVFINGESGAGKEVIARMIHQLSSRCDKAFVKVNCAALPGELLESELFGYEQGAFTGAVRAKPGKFESADRGTIFLDEIAEMAPGLQAKLLHVLQDNQFSRLGGRVTLQADVRVLAATNTPVQEAIRTGQFRKDLYYRLSVFSLYVPPLRERREEISLLFRHFVEKYSRKYERVCADPPAYLLDAATRYNWPGNLRELENLVKRYVILGDAEETFRELVDLARFERRLAQEESPAAEARSLKVRMREMKDDAELEAILGALEKTRWCRKRAAEQLGISYKAMLNKMRRFHLDGGPGSRAAATAATSRVLPGGSERGDSIWEAKQQ
jgi:two-component system response regulator AtoC